MPTAARCCHRSTPRLRLRVIRTRGMALFQRRCASGAEAVVDSNTQREYLRAMHALREHPRIWPPFLLDLSRTVDVKSEVSKLPFGLGQASMFCIRADLKLVYYLVCMVRYIRANNAIYKDNSMHSRHKCDEQIETPFMIWNHLVGEYSTAKAQSRARRITREDQHKVMIHFTALLLHTCRGSVFSSDLASVLNIDGDRSQMYLRQLGCVLAPTKLGQSGRQAVLQLPLKLPSLGERKRPK
eukprot:1856565-Pleurochrysis_carterae.AAC.1